MIIIPRRKELKRKSRRNEKNELLKTLANFDTIGVNEGLFTMSCKKQLEFARNVKKVM